MSDQPSNPTATPTSAPADPKAAAIEAARQARERVSSQTAAPAPTPVETAQPTEQPPSKSAVLKSDEALQKLREAAKPKPPPDYTPVLEKLRAGDSSDALQAFEELGLTEERLTELLLGIKPQKKEGDEAPNPLLTKLEALEKQLAEQERARTLDMVRSEIREFTKAEPERWELLTQLDGYESEVIDYIETVAERGKEVSYETAMDVLEKYMQDELERAIEMAKSSKKLSSKITVGQPVVQEPAQPKRPALIPSVSAPADEKPRILSREELKAETLAKVKALRN